MKKLLIMALAIGMTAPVFAQKIDMGSRARMRAAAFDPAHPGMRKAPGRDNTVRGFVTLASGKDAAALHQTTGVTVDNVRGRMALVQATPDGLDSMLAIPGVRRFTTERTLRPHMDRARKLTGVDRIHAGDGLDRAYTGKGVVCGIVDGGFDFNHANFKTTPTDENPYGNRIRNYMQIRQSTSQGYVQQTYTPEQIAKLTTEDNSNFHGTHTMGIMAGGYRGDLTTARPALDASGNPILDDKGYPIGDVYTGPNPYYGIATGADIACASGALSDYFISLGVVSILDYAESVKKPAVINLSLGSNVGPHDGSSAICQYMDAVSMYDPVNTIFCVSAGNEGDLPIAISATLEGENAQMGSFLKPEVEMANYQNVRYGQTYIYSDSMEPFEVQAVVVNKTRNGVAVRMPLPASPEGAASYWITSEDFRYDDTDQINVGLARYLEGSVGIGAEIDSIAGRYYAVLDVTCWDNVQNNPTGNYVLGFIVKGKPGQRISVYNDGVYNTLTSYGLDGYTDGSCDGSISDMACGYTPVVVGSYNTRDDWASIDGYIYGYRGGFPEGRISSFTSYGTLLDGRTLPHVCAPGATIVSSSNEYYLEGAQADNSARQAHMTADGRGHSWHQMVGTSMACPMVAGSVALWLEADPTLRWKDVHDVIAKTAVKDDAVLTHSAPVQAGMGKFDAYEGLKEVIRNASVGSISLDTDSRLLLRNNGARNFNVMLPGAENLNVTVYNVAGTAVYSAVSAGCEADVDLSPLPAGIYVIKVNGAHSKKLAL